MTPRSIRRLLTFVGDFSSVDPIENYNFHGSRIGRLSSLFASSSLTNRSLTGSQFNGRRRS